nr:MAG TPA: hypothetical protein [Caudoviricetes sp.]
MILNNKKTALRVVQSSLLTFVGVSAYTLGAVFIKYLLSRKL